MKVDAVSINGKVYDPEDALISAVDQGFMFGHGAFETFRVSGGRVFLFDEHLQRLEKNLRALNINWSYDKSIHSVWIKKIIDITPEDKDAQIRFCVTSGPYGHNPNVIIYLALIDKYKASEKKVQILKSLTRHKPEYFETIGFRIKSLEYSYLYLARRELDDIYTAGVLLNPDGYVAEALTSNVFWCCNGKLFTPPLSLGILDGTMRGWVLDNFEVEEKLSKREDLLKADEIFLTAGASYIVAVSEIDGSKKPGLQGSVYKIFYKTLIEHLKKNQPTI